MKNWDKTITLGQIIGILDPLSHIVIWISHTDPVFDDEETPDYEGSVMDIPWYLLDYFIRADVDYELRVSQSEDRNFPFFVLNLWESDDTEKDDN